MGRGVANNQRASVVLQGSGQNLRSRSAEAAGKDNQRTAVKNVRVRVFIDQNLAVRILDLNDRSFFDEKPGEADRLLERAAAVPSQVQNDASHLFLRELSQQPRDVCGGAFRLAP